MPGKQKLLSILFLFGIMTGCQEIGEQGGATRTSDATVDSRQGLKVFVYSQPQHDYEKLGIVKNNLIEQVEEGSEKEGWNKVKELVGAAQKNMDFSKLLDHMLDRARKEYKGQEPEGVIFREDLSQGKVIKFEN